MAKREGVRWVNDFSGDKRRWRVGRGVKVHGEPVAHVYAEDRECVATCDSADLAQELVEEHNDRLPAWSSKS